MLLGEIVPQQLALFLPRYSANQLVEVFSVVGGVPKYLEMWNDRRPVLRNIEETVLSPMSIFRHEPILLIQDEIAEPRTYLAILEALGTGAGTPTQISKRTGIALPHVGKYLRTLRDLTMIRRIVSLEAVGQRDTRQTRYEIADPYLRFHFTFIRPYQHLLEQGRVGRLMEIIRERFHAHVCKNGYEEVCRRHVVSLADAHELPFDAMEVGRIWDRRVEIDVAALDKRSKSVLLGECKWGRRKLAVSDLERLLRKAGRLTKVTDYQKHYIMFSRAGFTADLKKHALEKGVILVQGPLI
jgi:AAA+ ATPase superfamily predicted ATPase